MRQRQLAEGPSGGGRRRQPGGPGAACWAINHLLVVVGVQLSATRACKARLTRALLAFSACEPQAAPQCPACVSLWFKEPTGSGGAFTVKLGFGGHAGGLQHPRCALTATKDGTNWGAWRLTCREASLMLPAARPLTCRRKRTPVSGISQRFRMQSFTQCKTFGKRTSCM